MELGEKNGLKEMYVNQILECDVLESKKQENDCYLESRPPGRCKPLKYLLGFQ